MNIRRSHLRVWFVIGGLMVLAVVVLSLLPPGDMPRLSVSDKLEHGAAYGVLALWFAGLMQPRRYWVLALLLFIMGAVLELTQGGMHVGRKRDSFDLAANSAGIVVGLGLSLLGLRRWAEWVEKWLTTR